MSTPESQSSERPARLPVLAELGKPFRVPMLISSEIGTREAANRPMVVVDKSPFVINGLTGYVEFSLEEPLQDAQPLMFPISGVKSPVEISVAIDDIPPSDVALYECTLSIAGKKLYSPSYWDQVVINREQNSTIMFDSWLDEATRERTIEDCVPLNPQFVREYMTLTIDKFDKKTVRS